MTFAKITIQALISADQQKSWNFYTDPGHITQWNFATQDWCCPAAKADLVEGGKFSWRMEAKDGSVGFDFEGRYTELVPLEKINYILADEREVAITFKGTAEGTLVQIVFDAENENSLELQQLGWQAILNQYKFYTENN